MLIGLFLQVSHEDSPNGITFSKDGSSFVPILLSSTKYIQLASGNLEHSFLFSFLQFGLKAEVCLL